MQFLNVIINNGLVQMEDRASLFPDEEMVHVFPLFEWVMSDRSRAMVQINGKDMFDLLIILGVFKSKGQARKNWKKTGRDIPSGWTQLDGLGKIRRELCIWNPTE